MLAEIGRALRHRNYRLFFAGQTISLIGTWLTKVATSWLVYRLTGSAWMLGIVGFAGQLPTFLLSPVAGVLTDRWNLHRLLVATQVLAMVQSGLLAYYALSGTITVTHVLLLSVFQALINAFDVPARQAFVVEMLESRDDLPNAIALNSSMVNAARLIGPSLAGVLIAAVGEGWCFAIDAASYIAVVASLLAMRIAARPIARTGQNLLQELRQGARYVAGFPPILAILLLIALVSLTGVPYLLLLPVITDQVFHGGAGMLGILTAASGVGALAGALYLASRNTVLGLGRWIAVSALAFGAGLIGLGLSRWLALSLALMALTGFGMMVQMAASNTVLQTLSDEDKRGRVMSYYTMAFFGTQPLGSLLSGAVADRIGAPETLMIGGALCVLAALAFTRALPSLRRHAHPVYVKRGVIPEVATGLSSASQPSAGPGD